MDPWFSKYRPAATPSFGNQKSRFWSASIRSRLESETLGRSQESVFLMSLPSDPGTTL